MKQNKDDQEYTLIHKRLLLISYWSYNLVTFFTVFLKLREREKNQVMFWILVSCSVEIDQIMIEVKYYKFRCISTVTSFKS